MTYGIDVKVSLPREIQSDWLREKFRLNHFEKFRVIGSDFVLRGWKDHAEYFARK